MTYAIPDENDYLSDRTDDDLLRKLGHWAARARLTRVGYGCVVAHLANGAFILAHDDRTLCTLEMNLDEFYVHANRPEAIPLLNLSKALFARAGVVAPDVGGEFVRSDWHRDLAQHLVRFSIPTPDGPPVRVSGDSLRFDFSGRVDHMLADEFDIKVSRPSELEQAFVLAARTPDMHSLRAARSDVVTLYKLRGGDPESRFTQEFLTAIRGA